MISPNQRMLLKEVPTTVESRSQKQVRGKQTMQPRQGRGAQIAQSGVGQPYGRLVPISTSRIPKASIITSQEAIFSIYSTKFSFNCSKYNEPTIYVYAISTSHLSAMRAQLYMSDGMSVFRVSDHVSQRLVTCLCRLRQFTKSHAFNSTLFE